MKKYFYILGIIGLSTLNATAVQNAYPLKGHPYIIITKNKLINVIEYDYVNLNKVTIIHVTKDRKSEFKVSCKYWVGNSEKMNEKDSKLSLKYYKAIKEAYKRKHY